MATVVGTGVPVSVGFLGFHEGFERPWNYLTRSLAHRFELQVSGYRDDGHLDEVPEVLFTSIFDNRGRGLQHQFPLFGSRGDPDEVPLYRDPRYDSCAKVHVSDEYVRPPWRECDYAVTGDYDPDPRHLRLPVYVRYWRDLPYLESTRRMRLPNTSLSWQGFERWDEVVRSKTKFCAFIHSNPYGTERLKFVELLSRYKRVDCGGSLLNNLGFRVGKYDKLPFLEDYKFAVCFENTSYPGYVTEKLVDAAVARCVPIYWGSPRIEDDFRTGGMVVATGRHLEDVAEEVAELDRDDALYQAKLLEPLFRGDVPNRYCQPDYLADFFHSVYDRRRAARGESADGAPGR